MAPCFSITSPSRKKSYFFHISRRGLLLRYHAPFPGSVTQASGKTFFSKLKKDKKIFLLSFPAQKKDFFPLLNLPFFKVRATAMGLRQIQGMQESAEIHFIFSRNKGSGGNKCLYRHKKREALPAGGAGQRLLGREIFGLRRTADVARGIPAFRP